MLIDSLNVKIPKRDLKLDVILPDAQVGFKRDLNTGKLTNKADCTNNL